jgi:hypothetical protein
VCVCVCVCARTRACVSACLHGSMCGTYKCTYMQVYWYLRTYLFVHVVVVAYVCAYGDFLFNCLRVDMEQLMILILHNNYKLLYVRTPQARNMLLILMFVQDFYQAVGTWTCMYVHACFCYYKWSSIISGCN